jgi:VanZ family protein
MSTRAWQFFYRFGPVLVWIATISGFSTEGFSGEHTSRMLMPLLRWVFPAADPATLHLIHAGLRTGMHVAEYGILALLWYRAIDMGRHRGQAVTILLAFALTIFIAGLDEVHQLFARGRWGKMTDWGWDCLGAALALSAFQAMRYRLRPTAVAEEPGEQ